MCMGPVNGGGMPPTKIPGQTTPAQDTSGGGDTAVAGASAAMSAVAEALKGLVAALKGANVSPELIAQVEAAVEALGVPPMKQVDGGGPDAPRPPVATHGHPGRRLRQHLPLRRDLLRWMTRAVPGSPTKYGLTLKAGTKLRDIGGVGDGPQADGSYMRTYHYTTKADNVREFVVRWRVQGSEWKDSGARNWPQPSTQPSGALAEGLKERPGSGAVTAARSSARHRCTSGTRFGAPHSS